MLLGLLACTNPTPPARPEAPPPPVPVVPAQPAPPTLGAVCDPAADACGPAGRCCQPCCAPDAKPVCTTPDAAGACPQPDLVVREAILQGSLNQDVLYAAPDSCAVQLGCVGAAGTREVLRFTSSTQNAGAGTFYLGKPEDHPSMFQWSACAGRWRLEGYEVFRLVDGQGKVVASGQKAGYCLMDAMDAGAEGRKPRYTCAEQGITPGWADLYANRDDCQWVDVTDVPNGDYTLEIEVDPGKRWTESNEGNNVTRVPVHLGPQ